MSGWIKLHRKLVDWEWYSDVPCKTLFIHLLLVANHKPSRWKGIDIGVGQKVTGRHALSEETGLSQQEIRTALTKLKSTGEITIKSTNKFSLITVCKYEDYQSCETVDQPAHQPAYQPTINQQSTTNKNDKNVKNNIEYSKEYSVGHACPTVPFDIQNDDHENQDQEQVAPAPRPDPVPYAKIIAHLNEKCGCQFKPSNQATRSHIKARWNEGFRFNDFIAVIDFKFAEWAGDEKMCRFIRPQTLFGTKFESYLIASKKNEVNGRDIVKKDDKKMEAYSIKLNELLNGESPFDYGNREGIDALRKLQSIAQQAAVGA